MIERLTDTLTEAGAHVRLTSVTGRPEWRACVSTVLHVLGDGTGPTMAQALRQAAARARVRLKADEDLRGPNWEQIVAACDVVVG